MNWTRIATTKDIRVYQAGNYRVIGAFYPGHEIDFTLSYKATGLGVHPTLTAAKARAATHAKLSAKVIEDLRATGRLN